MSRTTEIECKGTTNILISQAIYLKTVYFLNESTLFIKIHTICKNNIRAY